MRCTRSDPPRDEGYATAELAACLPVLVVLLAFVLSVVSVGSARVRVQDAAREAARAAARGDAADAPRLARAAAPGATVRLERGGGDVTAVVRIRQPLLASWLPSVTITGQAVAAAEPSAAASASDSAVPP